MLETLNLVILIAAGLVAVSVFTSLVSFRVGAPLLLVFLLVGLAAGEDGPGGIAFSDTRTAYFIGSIALAIILFDSGFRTRLATFRLAAAPALALATLGVAITAGVVGAGAHYLFGWAWTDGLLLGAIVGSTDAAAVFFLLRVGGVNLREMISATLEVESGSNDPMAIFLTMTLLGMITAGTVEADAAAGADLALELVRQMGLGFVAGLAGGYAIVQIVNRVNLEPALYPIVVLALALALSGATSLVGGSGFLRFYDSQVTVIPEGGKREFLGWLSPGANKYTFSKTFLSAFLPERDASLDSDEHGSHRAIVLNNIYDSLVPLDIMTYFLLKAVLAENIDEAEQLGILECDEEDFALCSFACPSKTVH